MDVALRGSLCISTYCNFILVISHFGFEGGNLVLIASVPGHCLYFIFLTSIRNICFGAKIRKNVTMFDRLLPYKIGFSECGVDVGGGLNYTVMLP